MYELYMDANPKTGELSMLLPPAGPYSQHRLCNRHKSLAALVPLTHLAHHRRACISAENFRALCTGEKDDVGGVRLWYKNTPFHQVAKGSYMMGGDITTRNGHGGRSIYGQHFPQENFKLKHVGPGILGCVAHGPNIQSSQFYVTTQKMSQLDGKLVVFGRVVEVRSDRIMHLCMSVLCVGCALFDFCVCFCIVALISGNGYCEED